jgi:hypothetical protein
MVDVVNKALATNSLFTPVSSLDVKKKPAFKLSPHAAVFTPSSNFTSTPAAADADAFSLQSVVSEEL